MRKKILSLLLVLALLLPLIPVQAQAQIIVSDDEVETLIAQQFDAFVSTLHPEGASEAATEMVTHSMRTSARWDMTTADGFAKGLFSADLIRNSFIHMATEVHKVLSYNHDDYVFLRGGLSWYQNDMRYSNTAYEYYTDNNDKTDDVRYNPRITASDKEYSQPLDAYDESMLLVVGGSNLFTEFQQTSVTPESITYHVTLTVEDIFDFNVSVYKGSDRELEMFLTWAGKLLSLGLLKTFEWTATAEFDLTLPNLCPHEAGDYRWEFNGTEMVNVTGNGLTENPLTRLEYTSASTGNTYNYYSVYNPIRLYHDRPWVIEFQSEGKGSFALAEDATVANGYHLRRSSTTLFFGEVYKVNPTDEKNTYFYYGYKIQKKIDGIAYADLHTYRLENRIAEDGSNMVWLLIDGVEISAMNNHYLGSVSQETTVDWVNGKDFVFRYIGNKSYPFKNITVNYIQIWENGEGNEPFSYRVGETVAPSCTEAGYVQDTCTLCGAVFAAEDAAPTGHSFSEWEVIVEPCCWQNGLNIRQCTVCGKTESVETPATSHTYTQTSVTAPDCDDAGFTTDACTVCGHTRNRDEVPALGHTVVTDAGKSATCTESGLTDGSHCSICGETLSQHEIIPALGHSPVVDAAVAPTCTETGLTEGSHCGACGVTLMAQEVVPATGHHAVTDGTVAPSCTETGLTEGSHCGNCGMTMTAQEAIPALGHSPVADAAVAPTCTGTGLTEGSHCAVCQTVLNAQETVPALGHSWDEGTVTKEPAIEQEGEMLYTCTVCGGTQTEVLPPVPHTHEYGQWEIFKDPTSTTEGENRRFCYCGKQESMTVPALTNPFTDVERGSFYYEPVLWAGYRGITAGMSADTFAPYDTCTRAQVVTFLWRAMGKPEPETQENPFTDVPESEWYYKAVLWAVENGVTAGTEPGLFAPDEPCTRAQVVTFLWRAMDKVEPETTKNPFRDVRKDAYFYSPVLWAVENGITAGTAEDTFSPDTTCLRAQVVTFLYRALRKQ